MWLDETLLLVRHVARVGLGSHEAFYQHTHPIWDSHLADRNEKFSSYENFGLAALLPFTNKSEEKDKDDEQITD